MNKKNVQCRCKLCGAWFPYDLLINIDGRKHCPNCQLAEGVTIIEKEG